MTPSAAAAVGCVLPAGTAPRLWGTGPCSSDAGGTFHRQARPRRYTSGVAYARRAAEWGITVVTLDDVRRRGAADVASEALDIAGAGGGGIHLDIDVDVCDRSVAPACPASVPGGLAAWELRALVRALAGGAGLASADIVEVDATADAPDGRVLELLAGKAVHQ